MIYKGHKVDERDERCKIEVWDSDKYKVVDMPERM